MPDPLFLALGAVVGVVMYLSAYWGIFAIGNSLFAQRNILEKIIFLPACWVALELVRDRLFTGFGWATLGSTQYKILPLIQISAVTGVFGVSFWVFATNVLLKETISQVFFLSPSKRSTAKDIWYGGLVLWLSVTGLIVGHGFVSLRAEGLYPSVRVAVIQPNIQQVVKWDPVAWPGVMKRIKALTERVVPLRPDIIIWPETSFPGYIIDGQSEGLPEFRGFVRRLGIPLLFGAVEKKGEAFFNAAILLSAEGQEVLEHHKMHLVPFGEFLPFRHVIPFLGDIVPIGDFTAGTVPTLFPAFKREAVPAGQVARGEEIIPGHFSVLICFEDTVSTVARLLVRQGANFLVNMTNDAWFQPSLAPVLHLQAAVFQAVSHRRWLVRAANNGISGVVNANGRIEKGAVPIDQEGFFVGDVYLRTGQTFYARYGDVFACFCAVLFLGGAIFIKKNGTT